MLLPPQTPQANRQKYPEYSKHRDAYIDGAIARPIQPVESRNHPLITNDKNQERKHYSKNRLHRKLAAQVIYP